MSIYDGESFGGGSMYGPGPVGKVEQPEVKPASDPHPEPSASEAVSEAFQVIANPLKLVSDIIPANPSDSKLPYGLAVLGACVVAMIWANWVEGKVKS